MKKRDFNILKANGTTECFSRSKLYKSLRHSGLSNKQASIITDKVTHEVGEGSRTRDIYRKTLRLVNENSQVAAVHYSLKKSLFDLGPTGFHFERFVARYFEEQGYRTRVSVVLPGKWVKHEVDVIAEKSGQRFFIECKFHNRKGIKNDIKIALYVKARWDDLKNGPEGKNLDGFYLASNTAYTIDAMAYAQGSGLNLLGINAPKEESFLEQIKRMQLYPITSLRKLNKQMKEFLISQNIILAKDIPQKLDLLLKLGLKEGEINAVLREIELLKDSKI